MKRTEVTTVSASNAVSYALSEELDYELFDLDDTTFQLSFKESPDYEDPVDLDEDNIYEVVVVATNSNGTASQTVQITVQNVIEQPVITSFFTTVFNNGASLCHLYIFCKSQIISKNSATIIFMRL